MTDKRLTADKFDAREMRSKYAGIISGGSTDIMPLAAYRHYVTVSLMLGDMTSDEASEAISIARSVFISNVNAWVKAHGSVHRAVTDLMASLAAAMPSGQP
jgi:hypothetical protein